MPEPSCASTPRTTSAMDGSTITSRVPRVGFTFGGMSGCASRSDWGPVCSVTQLLRLPIAPRPSVHSVQLRAIRSRIRFFPHTFSETQRPPRSCRRGRSYLFPLETVANATVARWRLFVAIRRAHLFPTRPHRLVSSIAEDSDQEQLLLVFPC